MNYQIPLMIQMDWINMPSGRARAIAYGRYIQHEFNIQYTERFDVNRIPYTFHMTDYYNNVPPGLIRLDRHGFITSETESDAGEASEQESDVPELEDVPKSGLVKSDLLQKSKVFVKAFTGTETETDVYAVCTICAICQDEYTEQSIVRELVCKHDFHINCIDTWFIHNTTCPLCKTDLS
jgi:hypothetical protein